MGILQKLLIHYGCGENLLHHCSHKIFARFLVANCELYWIENWINLATEWSCYLFSLWIRTLNGDDVKDYKSLMIVVQNRWNWVNKVLLRRKEKKTLKTELFTLSFYD